MISIRKEYWSSGIEEWGVDMKLGNKNETSPYRLGVCIKNDSSTFTEGDIVQITYIEEKEKKTDVGKIKAVKHFDYINSALIELDVSDKYSSKTILIRTKDIREIKKV